MSHSHNACLLLVSLSLSGCALFEPYDWPELPTADERGEPPPEQRPRLEPLNRNYFVLADEAETVVGEPQLVFTRASDTFSDLAREYGLGYDELVAANPGIDPWLPGEGTAVLLPTQYVLPDATHRGLILNIATKRLFYFPPTPEGQPQAVMTYPIGIGRVGWETPTGETTVVSKAEDPHWYVPASVRREHADAGDPLPSVVPPGPDNPLGRHVLQLGLPGYLIHGTNQPYGVGMRVSHGCVRLYPENIELLYSMVDIGEVVAIVNQPYLVGRRGENVYVEAHTPLADDSMSLEERLERLQSDPALASEAARRTAEAIVARASGVPTPLTATDGVIEHHAVRIVRNTVQVDPDAPTLAEVRELLDEADEQTDAGETASFE